MQLSWAGGFLTPWLVTGKGGQLKINPWLPCLWFFSLTLLPSTSWSCAPNPWDPSPSLDAALLVASFPACCERFPPCPGDSLCPAIPLVSHYPGCWMRRGSIVLLISFQLHLEHCLVQGRCSNNICGIHEIIKKEQRFIHTSKQIKYLSWVSNTSETSSMWRTWTPLISMERNQPDLLYTDTMKGN